MSSSARSRALMLGLGVIAVIVVAVLISGSSSGYDVRFIMSDAQGIRQGTSVRIGDVSAGTVHSITLNKRDQVVVDARLDSDKGPVGKNASVSVEALNLLAQRYLAIKKGNVQDPAPSGYLLPSSRVTVSTNLEQVLSTLDANTRDRLGLLLNEAGIALSGRRGDVSLLLGQLPHTLSAMNDLLGRLVSDNATLGAVIDHGDRFITAMNTQRGQFVNLIDTLGKVSASLGSRQQELATTLARAPGMLRTTQAFLADLRDTTVPLGPAADNLSATAGPLVGTLRELRPFTDAATPTLRQATDDAPALTRLGQQATPVIARAAGTARALSVFSDASGQAAPTLNSSEDNIFAILDNWSHAIQYRDALSHYFRGEPAMTSDTVQSVIDRLMAANGHPPAAGASHRRAPAKASVPAHTPAPSGSPATNPVAAVGGLLNGVLGGVKKALPNGVGALLGGAGKTLGSVGALLGKTGKSLGDAAAALHLGGGSGPKKPPAQNLSALLNYLLGR